jgi:hypothetical protein
MSVDAPESNRLVATTPLRYSFTITLPRKLSSQPNPTTVNIINHATSPNLTTSLTSASPNRSTLNIFSSDPFRQFSSKFASFNSNFLGSNFNRFNPFSAAKINSNETSKTTESSPIKSADSSSSPETLSNSPQTPNSNPSSSLALFYNTIPVIGKYFAAVSRAASNSVSTPPPASPKSSPLTVESYRSYLLRLHHISHTHENNLNRLQNKKREFQGEKKQYLALINDAAEKETVSNYYNLHIQHCNLLIYIESNLLDNLAIQSNNIQNKIDNFQTEESVSSFNLSAEQLEKPDSELELLFWTEELRNKLEETAAINKSLIKVEKKAKSITKRAQTISNSPDKKSNPSSLPSNSIKIRKVPSDTVIKFHSFLRSQVNLYHPPAFGAENAENLDTADEFYWFYLDMSIQTEFEQYFLNSNHNSSGNSSNYPGLVDLAVPSAAYQYFHQLYMSYHPLADRAAALYDEIVAIFTAEYQLNNGALANPAVLFLQRYLTKQIIAKNRPNLHESKENSAIQLNFMEILTNSSIYSSGDHDYHNSTELAQLNAQYLLNCGKLQQKTMAELHIPQYLLPPDFAPNLSAAVAYPSSVAALSALELIELNGGQFVAIPSPHDMLWAIICVVKMASQTAANYQAKHSSRDKNSTQSSAELSADELFPLFILVLISSGIAHPHTLLRCFNLYIDREYREFGQSGMSYSIFEAAVQYITNYEEEAATGGR